MAKELLLAAIALPTGCLLWAYISTELDHRSFIEPADSWYTPPSLSQRKELRAKGELPATDFCVVAPALQNQAIAMLQNAPIVSVSKPKVATFCPSSLNPTAATLQGKTAFLVRGLYLNELTGGYGIISSVNMLWVEHGSLGHSAVRMQRQALIVFLKKQPTKVFVDCSMAE